MEESKIKHLKICHTVMFVIGIVIMLTSLSIFIASFYNFPTLTSWIDIKTNTAICFFLAGAVLLLMNKRNIRLFNYLIVIISIIIFSISCLTIIEYLFNVNFGIDKLLINNNPPLQANFLNTEGMTFITALTFLLTSLSFIFVLKKLISPWIFQTLACLIILIALMSFCNYINAVQDINRYTTMVVSTTLLFGLLGLGILLIKPDVGIVKLILKNSSGGFLLRYILPIIIIAAILVNIVKHNLETKNLVGINFGDTINILGDFIIVGFAIILLAKLIDRKEKNLEKSKLKIQHNEMIFHQFSKNIDAVFFTISPDFDQVLYVSPAYEKIWGKSTKSLYANPKDWFDSILPEDQKIINDTFFDGLAKGKLHASSEFRIRQPDGAIRNIFARIFVLKELHNDACIIGIAIDLTHEKIGKVYKKLQDDILHLIETKHSTTEFSSNALEKICTRLNWELGELWLIDEAKNNLYCVDVWNKNVSSLSSFSKKIRQYTFNKGDGFPGRIWEEQRIIWIKNYISNQALRPDENEQQDLYDVIGVPIIFQNKIIGILVFYSFHIENPDEEFLAVLENLGKFFGVFIQQIHTNKYIQEIAEQDVLTGVLSRSAFEKSLDNQIEREKSIPIAIIGIDIDRFRLINEAFGYALGDQLLKAIAARLRELIPDLKLKLARLGVDKFIFYIDKINKKTAIHYADLVNHKFQEPFEIAGNKIILSANIGIAIYPEDGIDSKTLITNTDLAVTQAKESTTNKICFFTTELPLIATKKMTMASDLRQAISNNEFFLVYQPQIDLNTQCICGAEALVRWQHTTKGLISPGDFIPFAEKTGLIVVLNEHIMRLVFKQISATPVNFPISINISAQQLQDGFHLIEYLELLMKEFSVHPNQIELELTENTLMENTHHNTAVLTALNGLGFKISIDDFGSGFSSFGYLSYLPIYKIKIDRAFISGLPENVANCKIVRSMVTMGHSLDKVVLAEGAETKAEIEFLIQEKCDIVQGYYYYKPLPFDKLITLS